MNPNAVQEERGPRKKVRCDENTKQIKKATKILAKPKIDEGKQCLVLE